VKPVDAALLRASRPARRHLAVTFALAAVSAVVIVAQAALLAAAIAQRSLAPLAALAAVVLMRALCDGAFEAVGQRGAARVMSDLRGRLAFQFLVARPDGLDTPRTGELATLAVQGVDAVEPYFARFLPQLALSTFVPVVVLAWLFSLAWVPALVLAATLPLIPLFMVLVGLATQARTASRLETLTLLSTHFLDVVRGLPTLRAHARDGAQGEVLARVGDAYRRETMGTLRIAFLSALVLEALAMLGTALVAGVVGVALAGGHLGLQAGLTVLLLAPELYAPLRAVGAQFHASADGLAALTRLREALDAPPALAAPVASSPTAAAPPLAAAAASPAGLPLAPAPPAPAGSPPAPTGAIALRGVDFAYPGGPAVLHGVDLSLAAGRTTAIVGPSGSGKSTLAKLVLRLADPTGGRVECGGVDLRAVDPAAWRARCAYVPQRSRLYAGTIAENLRLGRADASDEDLRAALAAAGAAFALPLLDEPVGDGGRALSAGEAQRIAIARAFVRDAPLLVLDEPTAHLDDASARVVEASLERLRAGRTTLLIAHRPELAATADTIVELRDGAVAAPERIAA